MSNGPGIHRCPSNDETSASYAVRGANIGPASADSIPAEALTPDLCCTGR